MRFVSVRATNSMNPIAPRGLMTICLIALVLTALPLVAPDAQVRQIPIRWCVVEGAPADNNPGAVGEPDTDNVLWRRHERPSDAIFIPQADVTLRSALYNIVEDATLEFPVIDDPDTDDPDHELGDILYPRIDSTEWDVAHNACVQAWSDDHGVEDIGVVALVARRIVDEDGDPIIFARARFGGRRVILEDNAWSLCGSTLLAASVCDPVDKTFGHEVGHTLPTDESSATNTDGLRHTCDDANLMRQGRQDTDGDDQLDNFTLSNNIDQVTNDGDDDAECTDDDGTESIDQIAAISETASLVPGCTLEGSGDPCSAQSDTRTDARADVAERALDLSALRITVRDDGIIEIVHELFATIDPEILPDFESIDYYALIDTDNDPTTGGTAAELGLDSAFAGAELATRVRVTGVAIPTQPPERGPQIVTPLFGAIGTVWRFEDVGFQEVQDESIRARVDPQIDVDELIEGGTSLSHAADSVVIEFAASLAEPRSVPVRTQALTRGVPVTGATILDKLDDRPEEPGYPLRLRFPTFPVCTIIPDPVLAGGAATVQASGLLPNAGVHVLFGPEEVGTGSTDDAGATTITFIVPGAARAGRHLVTVGVEGTGLTADCTVEVPEQRTRYEYPAKLVCGVQPGTRSMRLARGFYATTINVRNPQDHPVELTKILALTVPPGFEKPGELLPIAKDVLPPGYALAVDCDEIQRRVFQGALPSSYLEGFVVIQSVASLDVTAVYSTATLNADGTAEDQASIHVEPVRERIIEAAPPRERADLMVRDIDLASIDVNCPKGGGSCVTSVRVTIANIGTGDAGPFDTISVFDPNQSVTVGTHTPGGLAAGASRAFSVKTPPGGNCLDPNCTICVTIDSAAAVAESDETNNQLCRTKGG